MSTELQELNVGYTFIMPKTIPGSNEFYLEQFERAMSIIRKVRY